MKINKNLPQFTRKAQPFKNYVLSFFMTFIMINVMIPAAPAAQTTSQPRPPLVDNRFSMEGINKNSTTKTSLRIAKEYNRKKLIGNPNLARKFAKSKIGNRKQYKCLLHLWNSESNWRTLAKNRHSGAYGIPQALPGSKMASIGKDWKHSYKTQVTWGLKYIRLRYESPCNAWSFKQRNGWY